MKKFLTILLLCPLLLFGQSETHVFTTYDTTLTISGYEWIASISRPTGLFGTGADTASRPMIIMMPGQGQMGSANYSNLTTYGPHYWEANGWDGSVQLGNGTHYPIIITVTAVTNTYPSAVYYYALVQYLVTHYHAKPGSVYGTGLSEGSFAQGSLIEYEDTIGNHKGMKLMKAIACFEGTPQTSYYSSPGWPTPYPNSTWADTPYFATWATLYGGKFFYLEGSGSDNFRDGWHYAVEMNNAVANSAYFSYEDDGGGAHCCWNDFYNPAVTNWTTGTTFGTYTSASQAGTDVMGNYRPGTNVYQWMLEQGDTSLVGSGATPTGCRAFIWDSTNTNIALTGTSFGASPAIHRCDTIYIPNSLDTAGYRSFSDTSLGVQTDPNPGRIYIKGLHTTHIKIKPSTQSEQANIWGNDNWQEVDSIIMLHHKDPVIFNPYHGGYSHHMLFKGGNTTQTFFPSGDITTSLPNFAGDTVNCMFDWQWTGWRFDAGIGDTATPAGGGPFGGNTYLWLGALAKNGVWIDVEVDHSHFLNNASDSAPATDIHMENCFYCVIDYDTLENMGVVQHPVGHASVTFSKVSMVVEHNNLFKHNFGNTLTNRGEGDIPSDYTLFRYLANLKGDTSYDGQSEYFNNRDSGSRKYPGVESENDPGDTVYNSYYRARVAPRVVHNTFIRMNLGAGNQAYKNWAYDGYGGPTDSIYFWNNTWTSAVSDTVVSCPFSGSTTACGIFGFSNGTANFIDSGGNFQTFTMATAGLDSNTLIPLNPGPLYLSDHPVKPTTTYDFYNHARSATGNVSAGSTEWFAPTAPPAKCTNCIISPRRIILH